MKCGVLKSNEDMILALAGQFKQRWFRLICWAHVFNLTCYQLCDFVDQLVKALQRHRRGHGFDSR